MSTCKHVDIRTIKIETNSLGTTFKVDVPHPSTGENEEYEYYRDVWFKPYDMAMLTKYCEHTSYNYTYTGSSSYEQSSESKWFY